MTETSETRWGRLNEAGRQFFTQGDLARAEEAFQAAVREATSMGGDGQQQLATSLGFLGQLRYRQRAYAEAEALFRKALTLREQALGPEHLSVVQSINNLAALHYARGELALAEPLFSRALVISEAHLGDRHPDLAVNLNNLAKLYVRQRDFSAAAPLLLRLVVVKEGVHGPHHPEVAAVLVMLARARHALGEYASAEELCRRALEIQDAYLSPEDSALGGTRKLLAEILTARSAAGELRYTPPVSPLRQLEPPPTRAELPAPAYLDPSPPAFIAPPELAWAPSPPSPSAPPHDGDEPLAADAQRPDAESTNDEPADDLTNTPPEPFRIPIAPVEPASPMPPPVMRAEPRHEFIDPAPPARPPSDDWSVDPREVAEAPAGLGGHVPDEPVPEPARPQEDPTETWVVHEKPAAATSWEPEEQDSALFSENDEEAAAFIEAEMRARRPRRRSRRWKRTPVNLRSMAIAAALLMTVLAGGYFVLGRSDADAGTPPPTAEVDEEVPMPVVRSRPPAADFDRRLPPQAFEPDRSTTDAAISAIPPGTSVDDHLYGAPDGLEDPPLPSVRIRVDGVSRHIARAKARVDSVGREIPSEPIQFQRPPRP